ncbi:RNA-binding protein [bacterium]|nr:RNA-binding protein [bacterium]
MNLFVSNIDYTITEDDLTELFSKYGQVESVKILIDLESKKSKGYGFVLMADTDSGILAIQNIDKMKINGRPISVQVARPRPEAGAQKKQPREFNTRQNNYQDRPQRREYGGDRGNSGGYDNNRGGNYDNGGGDRFTKSGRKLRPRKPRSDSDE